MRSFAVLLLLLWGCATAAKPAPEPAEAIIPGSMCLTLLVRDGLGLPTAKSHHQPAAVKIALPRRLERLSSIDLERLALPPGVFLDQARLAPYSVASGALMPLRSPRKDAHLHFGGAQPDIHEVVFRKELSALLSRHFAVSMGADAYLGQGLTVSPVVNTFTGNLFVCSLDATALWKGLNVMVYRVYNGLRRVPGPFGPGWSHNFGARVDFNEDQSVQYTRWDGSGFCYKPDGQGGYISPSGFDDALTRSGTGFLLQDRAGFFLKFDGTGRLMEIGNTLQYRLRLTYRNGRLASIRNHRIEHGLLPATGIAVKKGTEAPIATNKGPGAFFGYDQAGRITQIRSTSGSQMDYTYDGAGRLASVTSNTQQTIRYRYDAQGRLAEVREPKARAGRPPVLATIRYDQRDRVSEISDEAGNPVMRMYYRWAQDRTTQVELGLKKFLVTDRYDERGVLVERVETDQSLDPLAAGGKGSQRQTREADADLNTTVLRRQDGTNTRWLYDRDGNMVRAQDSSGAWVEMTYDASTGLLDFIRESSNNRWLRFHYGLDGELREVELDDGNRFKLGYDDGGVPRELIDATGDSIPLDLGLPVEVPRRMWEF